MVVRAVLPVAVTLLTQFSGARFTRSQCDVAVPVKLEPQQRSTKLAGCSWCATGLLRRTRYHVV
jgi:hypothetical protein